MLIIRTCSLTRNFSIIVFKHLNLILRLMNDRPSKVYILKIDLDAIIKTK